MMNDWTVERKENEAVPRRERASVGVILLLGTLCLAVPGTPAAGDILPLEQVKPGMRGTARTIFAGEEVEQFDLEVLGVLRNLAGPRQDIILVRLLGEKVNYTGVVAGMSGSPVYLDGKLAGALAYRFGSFTKEPIAGVTPIENMLRAAQEEPPAAVAGGETLAPRRYRLPEEMLSAAGVRTSAEPYLTPIETPLTFVGFHPQVIHRFADQLARYGFLAVQGGGTAEPGGPLSLEPGGMVAGALVTGDMTVGGSCTITYRREDQLYACGHSLLALGNLQLPMARAEIVTTVPSQWASFKISNIGEVIGSFEQDRSSAIVGRVGAAPRMIPVDLTLVKRGRTSKYHYQIFQHPKLSPLLLNITLFNGLFFSLEAGAEISYRVRGRLELRNHADVVLDGMFSPTDSFFPDAFFVVNSVGENFRAVFTNPFESPVIERVTLRVELLPDRHAATIENAWSDKSEVRPGETLRIKVVLQPYRGARVVREVPVTIPPQAAKGPLRILVSDATLLNAVTRTLLLNPRLRGRFPGFGPRVTSLEQLISLLNRERRTDNLYVAVFQRTPTLLVQDKVLPSIPLSEINVLNRQSASVRPRSALLSYQSILHETAEPLGQVVSGSQWLRLTVR
ncbi:MAG: SpoIVB peptidase S55 domain-containing protein [Terriglobia bacterium]